MSKHEESPTVGEGINVQLALSAGVPIESVLRSGALDDRDYLLVVLPPDWDEDESAYLGVHTSIRALDAAQAVMALTGHLLEAAGLSDDLIVIHDGTQEEG